MKNLLQIREKIQRTNRLYESQLFATKVEKLLHTEDTSLKNQENKKEMKLKDSKN